MMNKKVVWVFIGLLGLMLFVSILGNVVLGSLAISKASLKHTPQSKYLQETVLESGSGSKKIALIKLEGLISYSMEGSLGDNMVDDIRLQLEEATNDKNVAAIVLFIDSPGGEVTASDELYRLVSKANKVKPVVAYINSVGASGAYYTAMGSRYIVANELSITASIGVILQTINYQHLADFIGIQTLTFKSGKMKDLLNPARPVTEEEKAYVQGLIDETYGKFVGIVAQHTHIKVEDLRNGVADGRIESGKDAKTLGLVDDTGYLDDAIHEAQKLSDTSNTTLIRYSFPFQLGNFLKLIGESKIPSEVKVNLLPEQVRLEAGKLYYLPPMFGAH